MAITEPTADAVELCDNELPEQEVDTATLARAAREAGGVDYLCHSTGDKHGEFIVISGCHVVQPEQRMGVWLHPGNSDIRWQRRANADGPAEIAEQFGKMGWVTLEVGE